MIYHGVASNIALKLLWIAINHLHRTILMDEDSDDDVGEEQDLTSCSIHPGVRSIAGWICCRTRITGKHQFTPGSLGNIKINQDHWKTPNYNTTTLPDTPQSFKIAS